MIITKDQIKKAEEITRKSPEKFFMVVDGTSDNSEMHVHGNMKGVGGTMLAMMEKNQLFAAIIISTGNAYMKLIDEGTIPMPEEWKQ